MYPLFILLAALSIEMGIDLLLSVLSPALRATKRMKNVERNLTITALAGAALLGASRVASNYYNFNGKNNFTPLSALL